MCVLTVGFGGGGQTFDALPVAGTAALLGQHGAPRTARCSYCSCNCNFGRDLHNVSTLTP